MTAYACWVPELEDEDKSKIIHGFDEQHAAMDYVKFHHPFDNESQAVDGYVVCVKDAKNNLSSVRITGYISIQYEFQKL